MPPSNAGGPRLRAGELQAAASGRRVRLPAKAGGWPISWYEECSYLEAEYLITAGGTVLEPGTSAYAMAIRLLPERKAQAEAELAKQGRRTGQALRILREDGLLGWQGEGGTHGQ